MSLKLPPAPSHDTEVSVDPRAGRISVTLFRFFSDLIAALSNSEATAGTETLAALKTLMPSAGDTAYVKGRSVDGDGGQGTFVWTTGDFSSQGVIDTNEGVFVKANSEALTTGAWVRQIEGPRWYSKWFGTVTTGSDNSAIIETALATMAIDDVDWARTLVIEPGVKFNRASLNPLPKRGFMEYAVDDDTRQNPYTARATSERITLAFNANDNGIVNEWRFEAPFNPGLIVNVLKDMPGHDGYLGTGQERIPDDTVSAKASILIEDEYVPTWNIIAEHFGPGTKSALDGTKLHGYRRRITITVDDTSGFTNTPGIKIVGLTSEAFGYMVSMTGTTVTLDWIYGQFLAGEELYDFITSARPVVASAAMTVTPGQHQWFGDNGAITFGVFPGNCIVDYTFGGRVMLTPTVDYSQVRTETVTKAALVFANDLVSSPSLGNQIVLDADNRMAARPGTAAATTGIGWVGAVGAMCAFDNSGSGSAPAGSFNVASVARNSTGVYTVTFISALATTSYNVHPTPTDPDDLIVCHAKSASNCSITVRNRSSGSVADLEGFCDLTVIGGH